MTPEARTKLVSLFSFFKAVEERRTTLVRNIEDRPWKLRWTDLPTHSSLEIKPPAAGNEFALTLTRPDIHPCPAPPASIKDWLVTGWEDPAKTAEPIRQKTESDDSGSPAEMHFDQQAERQEAWREWTFQRNRWADIELPARAALRIWERLFALHSQLLREGEALQLVLGDGVFDWNGAHHPILLKTVELSFDPIKRQFHIQDTETSPEFYSSLFADFPNLPVKQWQQEVNDGDLHPLGGEGVSDWLKAVMGSFQDGQFVLDEPKGKAPHQRIGRAPMLFLRKRETGRLSFLDEILAHLQTVDEVSDSLLRIVGCAPAQPLLPAEGGSDYANEAADILLSKPANAAQLSILRRLAHRHEVLVQGPPGTGKTHTIANLIGSLLAEGKSVLVASHTTKALRVLREQVVEPLRSLCVSVLDSDMAGKKELESAVASLATRLDDDLARLQREAADFEKRREQLVRVTENFHPVRDHFDVLIVDEASQEDVVGLAPFYMADKIIVVGDDEQVTPLDVGGEQQPIQDLIGQWLTDLPSPLLFDLRTSIYDRAQIAFGSTIRLKEHFRCVPEIIQLSNHLSYCGDIKPLRESASTPIKPPLVAHRVKGIRIGKENAEEAETITALIAAAIEHPEYARKTFGVISLLGTEQADKIERLLRTRLDAVEYEQRRILCGNPAQFQGDERDVMLLSVVDSKTEGDSPLGMKGDGADGLWKKRYNVAASRAKDQLWVVYSLDHLTQLKPGDLRRRLVEHALDPGALMRLAEEVTARTESPFEAEVYKRLVSKGYQVTPQWRVGAYRIDLVVEGVDGKRLAVECDGDRWHYDKVSEDMARQALLERLGWRFVRIRGTTFYRNRDQAMQPLYQRLGDMEIVPVATADIEPDQVAPDPLLERVTRRAAELRTLWATANNE